MLIGARGSGETEKRNSGLGPEVLTLYKQLKSDLNGKLTVESIPVNYRAASTDVLKPSAAEIATLTAALALAPAAAALEIAAFQEIYKVTHLNPFLSSIDGGLTSAMNELSTKAESCPDTRFVLAGYSQGAMVIHQLLLRLTDAPNNALLHRVAASALIADGDRVKGTNALSYWSSPTPPVHQGMEAYFGNGGRDVPMKPTTYSVCNAGDLVCDFQLTSLLGYQQGADIHTSYVNTKLVKGVGTSIAKQLLGTVLRPTDHLVISPAIADIVIGQSQTYSAEGFDSTNASLGDATASTTFSISPDGSCIGSTCTASSPGPHRVTGKNSSKVSHAILNVRAVDHLTISPVTSTIASGSTQQYTVAAFDSAKTPLGDISDITTFAITPDGSCTGAACTATAPGTHTVTATAAGKTGTATLTIASNPAAGIANVRSVIPAWRTTFALTLEGAVWAWGANDEGQLGNGSTTNSNVPLQVPGLTGIQSIATNGNSVFAVTTSGVVLAWGANNVGQLGDGSTTSRTVPKAVPNLTAVQSIGSFGGSTYAIKTDGTLWSWGYNGNDGSGVLGIGNLPDMYSPVPTQVTSLSGVQSITVGDTSAVYAIDSEARLWVWGANLATFGNGSTSSSSYPRLVNGLPGVRSISTDGYTVLALTSDRNVWSWGANPSGQLGTGSFSPTSLVPAQIANLSDVQEVGITRLGGSAVKSDGTMWTWGNKLVLGTGSAVDSYVPVQVPGLNNVQDISSTRASFFATKADGTVSAWGSNFQGQLGNGTVADSATPTQVVGLTGVQRLYTAYPFADNSIFGLDGAGNLWAWGNNDLGQLGTGSNNGSSVPVKVS